jgi:acyl carrier protein
MTRNDRLGVCLKRVIGPLPNDLTPTSGLADDLSMDSLDIVELVMNVEAEFKVEITEEQGDRLHTWGDVIKLVDKLVSKQQRAQTRQVAAAAAPVSTPSAPAITN